MSGDVAVYIPNLNGGGRLSVCLDALRRQTLTPRIVVIDNGSTDGSADTVAERYPEATLLRSDTNVGFGRALNLGVRAAPATHLIFVNNDVECDPTFVEALVTAADGATMVAGVLLRQGSRDEIDSAGAAADQTLLAWDYLHGRPLEDAETAPAPLGPCGGAALYPRRPFERIGGFDERIFAYLEDVDLALRLRARGIRCALAPSARGIHHHSATLGSGSAAKNRLMGWSRGYLLRKYGIIDGPSTAARVLLVEGAICTGQIVVDRNTSGVTGRLAGWRAAGPLPRLRHGPAGLSELTLVESLRRRLVRRHSLARLGSTV